MIIGGWGPALDVTVDLYTALATAEVRIGATAFCDVGLRQAAAMAVIFDALTT